MLSSPSVYCHLHGRFSPLPGITLIRPTQLATALTMDLHVTNAPSSPFGLPILLGCTTGWSNPVLHSVHQRCYHVILGHASTKPFGRFAVSVDSVQFLLVTQGARRNYWQSPLITTAVTFLVTLVTTAATKFVSCTIPEQLNQVIAAASKERLL
jgi:hypothetical protein